MDDQAKALADLTAAIAGLTAKIESLHPVVLDLQSWKPSIKQSVEDLRQEVGTLRTQIGDKAPPTSKETAPQHVRLTDLPPLLPDALEVPRPPPLGLLHAGDDHGHGPDGHGIVTDLRGESSGEIQTPRLPPATGTSDSFHYGEHSFSGDHGYQRLPPPPRFDFPLFDGINPKAWRLKCEAYFRVCTLSPDTWVSCAAMYFTDGALTWLQSSQAHLHYQDRGGFAAAIYTQFGREEFQNLLCQFNRLKQTGTIVEYVEQFTQIMHHLLAHHTSWDPAFFVTQFMEGLQHEIRSVVVLHHPQTLDTAVDLACLQEEVMEAFRREHRRPTVLSVSSGNACALARTTLPLPLPPGKQGSGTPVRAMTIVAPPTSIDRRPARTSWQLFGRTAAPRASALPAESDGVESTGALPLSSSMW
ncbi:uncharacterized protein LOC119279846 [Triticum dicoccoides]|uniref:uncharacterized protein LOC119279846 n=1 Tax=Triticum dicoccoides TaxID=85692 RepID=UPI00188E48C7|nr:uncharacterized protein LOC119279846 [Triticum dicoccoides]